MPRQLSHHIISGLVTSGVFLAALSMASGPAAAKDVLPPPTSPPSTGADSDGTKISSHVTVTGSGADGGTDAKPIVSSDVNWTAPLR